MRLTSYLKELNLELYDFNLVERSHSSIIKEQNISIFEKGYAIDSSIYLGENFCIINTRRENDHILTELVNINGPYVRITHLLKGQLVITQKNNIKKSIHSGKLSIGFGNSINNEVITPAGKTVESVLIFITYSRFCELMHKEKDWSFDNEILRKITFENQEEKPIVQSFNITIPLQNIFDAILESCKYADSNYLSLKLRELLFILTLQVNTNQKNTNPAIQNQNYDKIANAKKFIDEHYTETPTIKFLSRHVLLNENQLKKDFKNIYKKTIRSYIIDLKMKKALELIDEHTIKEIADYVGYQSASHFITTFKKVYHCLPSAMKNK